MMYREFRIICDCQHHAARERTLWRRSLRLTQRIARHVSPNGIALIIGVPLAFGAIGIPIKAMNIAAAPAIERRIHSLEAKARSSFRIFTTPKTKREFFAPPPTAPRQLTFEVAKEEFFAAHVPYGSIIYREAHRNGLAPELVAAVIQAESDFRVRLVSDKSAQGLMQIVPET